MGTIILMIMPNFMTKHIIVCLGGYFMGNTRLYYLTKYPTLNKLKNGGRR